MGNILDMQSIRQLNLFNNITKVRTRFCFRYNQILFFCVPHQLVQKAVGENGKHVKKIREILGVKVKVIPSPNGISYARKFIENIVAPVRVNEIESKGDELIVSAGRQSKAALIGREKRRLKEMQEIVRNFFGKELKIV